MKNFVLDLCSWEDCETGKKEVEKGIGVCSAFPGSTPANVSACYAYNGSCYVCDKSKGDYVDCNADWLWNFNFPTHDWFKQVDCNDPYEEENCPDPSYSLKKSLEMASRENENYVNECYSVDFVKSSKMYNALGRNVKNPGKWEKVYEKNDFRQKKLIDNKYAILFIRGERPIKDFKYDILKHPNVEYTTDGKGKAYEHGKVDKSIATVVIDYDVDNYNFVNMEEVEESYEVISSEDMDDYLKEREDKNENK